MNIRTSSSVMTAGVVGHVVVYFLAIWSLPAVVWSRTAVSIQPTQPRWGASVTVMCDPEARNAGFRMTDPVVVVYAMVRADSLVLERRWAYPERTRERFVLRLTVPEQTAALSVWCIVLHRPRFYSGITVPILMPDGRPARHAYEMLITPLTGWDPALQKRVYTGYFRKELAFYPDNFAVYAEKWSFEFNHRILDRTRLETELTAILHDSGPPTVEKLYALTIGNIYMDDAARSLSYLRQLVERFPTSTYTWRALAHFIYHFRLYRQDSTEEVRKAETWRRMLMERYPEAPAIRESVLYEKDFSLETIAAAARSMLQEQSDNPLPYAALARAYLKRGVYLDRAAEWMERAIQLTLRGFWQIYLDLYGRSVLRELALLYQTAAAIYQNLNRPERALAYARIARDIQQQAGVPDIRPILLEAHIWEQMYRWDQAERLYLEALRIGDPESEDPRLNAAPALQALRRLYVLHHGSDTGFQAYLSKYTDRSETSATMAPDFNLRTLDGHRVRLADLRGKIVVLNFWTTTCGPCRAEIPKLNELVNEFQGQPVVFLALTPEPAKMVRDFLREHPFRYTIIPEATTALEAFAINAYPTHMIIDPRGFIAYRSSGGSPQLIRFLRKRIQKVLSKPTIRKGPRQ